MTSEKVRVDFAASKFNPSNFPLRDSWLQNVVYVGTTHKNDVTPPYGRTVMVTELHYDVLGVGNVVRTRRCFVVQSYMDNNQPTPKPVLLCAFPGSSSLPGATGGALDLWNYTQGAATSNIEFDWPIEVVRDTGCFAVMIDPPRYGLNSYNPTNAYDGMIDAISGIDAALWWIGTPALQWFPTIKTYDRGEPLMRVSPKLLLGGLSYGAITTSFMAGLLPDAYAAYMSGPFLVRANQPSSPEFNPADWGADYDFSDMLLAAPGFQKCKLSFGWINPAGNNAIPYSDYALVVDSLPDWYPNVLACNAKLLTDPRFEVRLKATAPVVQGHEVDLPDIRAWMTSRASEII